MKLLVAVIASFLSVPLSLAGTGFSAGELVKDCKKDTTTLASTPDDHYSTGLCVGYVLGWMDATTDSDIVTEQGPARVIFEEGVNVGQIKRVFIKYMDLHPEFEHEPASSTLTKAVQEEHLAHAKRVDQPLVKEQ